MQEEKRPTRKENWDEWKSSFLPYLTFVAISDVKTAIFFHCQVARLWNNSPDSSKERR